MLTIRQCVLMEKRRARDRLEEMRHASEKNMGERTDKSARGGREWAQDR